MPERVTKEERLVSLAIEKARKTAEMLRQESTQIVPYDSEPEMEKVKRPKVQNAKISTVTNDENGFGAAGESFKKGDEEDLKGICREKIEQIQEGMYSLSKSQLEDLFDALNDIVSSIL